MVQVMTDVGKQEGRHHRVDNHHFRSPLCRVKQWGAVKVNVVLTPLHFYHDNLIYLGSY